MNSEKREIIPAGSTVIESPGSRMIIEPEGCQPRWANSAEEEVVAEGGDWVLDGGEVRLKGQWPNAVTALVGAGVFTGASGMGLPHFVDQYDQTVGVLTRGLLAVDGIGVVGNLSRLIVLPELRFVEEKVIRRVNSKAENVNLTGNLG